MVSEYPYFKQVPKLFDGQLSGKPAYKGWPNKTLWRLNAGRLWCNVVLGRQSKRGLGSSKDEGKGKQAAGCLTKREN